MELCGLSPTFLFNFNGLHIPPEPPSTTMSRCLNSTGVFALVCPPSHRFLCLEFYVLLRAADPRLINHPCLPRTMGIPETWDFQC